MHIIGYLFHRNGGNKHEKKTKFRIVQRIFNIALIIGLLAITQTALAQEGETAVSAVNTVWVLVAAFLGFFMQAGFVRSKNVVDVMAENLMSWRT